MSNLQCSSIQFLFVMKHEVVSIKRCSKSSDDVFNTRNLLWLSTICLQSDGSPAAFCDFKQTHTVNINRAVGIGREFPPMQRGRHIRPALSIFPPCFYTFLSGHTPDSYRIPRTCVPVPPHPEPPAPPRGLQVCG